MDNLLKRIGLTLLLLEPSPMNPSKLTQVDRVDTLIITVGTRQVGWLCQDGIVRCFGADSDRGHPPHINELYRELQIERKYHEENKPAYFWSVRHLGQRYWDYCTEWLGGDFTAVRLLLDDPIIAESVPKGLKHIILWATNQPESTPWNYRRADTLWLAELMKGKIEQTWPGVQVDVVAPIVAANKRELIRQELEGFIFPLAVEALPSREDPPVFLVENKGAVPAIAESLEICAAALVRQVQVLNANPIEPQTLYVEGANGKRSAQTASQYELFAVSEYFWPVERQQIITIWEKGDFRTCQILLQAHQLRHRVLYQLAGYLANVTNWEIEPFLNNRNFETGWLRSRNLEDLAGGARVQQWRNQLLETRQDAVQATLETFFLIELQLTQNNYTTAFMQLAQTLERLLYLRHQQENWIELGLISIPDYWDMNRRPYDPTIKELIEAWQRRDNLSRNNPYVKLLNEIRLSRNDIVHQAKPITRNDLERLWEQQNLLSENLQETQQIVLLWREVIQKIASPHWQIPETSLLKSLSDWGIQTLKEESAHVL
ncbi:hypothetical protein PN462_11485 [Spirulina sp. CS-785/01]|uniref:hypothetical protein n=1 Tax=Spirulina sp. CS-785/01 TaxID=3021716 RepID=UPI002330A534|nr:hypothetical protein [Spirulina sp. CS-785/01]MDB9313723.1 hypothetical protein [Spirulina sp. CS-785/01]